VEEELSSADVVKNKVKFLLRKRGDVQSECVKRTANRGGREGLTGVWKE